MSHVTTHKTTPQSRLPSKRNLSEQFLDKPQEVINIIHDVDLPLAKLVLALHKDRELPDKTVYNIVFVSAVLQERMAKP